MNIAVVDNPEAGRFEIHVDGELAGLATYRRDDAVVSFLHTEVDAAFEGRGLGSMLVRTALQAARDSGMTAVPYCPFVRSYMRRHTEYRDLLPSDLRDEFAAGAEPPCEGG